jgi:hypothetical protein
MNNTRIAGSSSRLPAFLTIVGAALALTLSACEGENTTGRRVDLQTRLVSDLDASHTVTTSMGWTVTLTRAQAATGAFHYYDGDPAFTKRERAGWARSLWAALSPIGTAHAHPGHYIAGNAKGEMLAPFSVDLLAGPTDLPAGDGITGDVRSATFSFAAPSAGPVVEALAGHVAVTEGTATKDAMTIHFALAADLADVERTAKDAEITGCTFDEAHIDAPGTVTVTVKPRVWFNLVDFSAIASGTADAPTVVDTGAIAHVAFALGLAQLSAYEFSYAPTTTK